MIRHLRFFSGVALSAALALGSVVPALADNPYGDIAVSPSTGQTARSWDWGTQSAADAKAISLCNALTNGVNDCISQLEVHSHVCGAIAFDSALNQWRGGRGNTVAEADSNALAALSISNGTVARHVCNTVSSSNGNGSNSTGSNNRYGAIAVSPNTLGSYGSWDFSSQSAADNNAIAGCNGRSNGANDCLRVVMIHNQTCGALAEDNSQNTWKDGHGNTHAAANSDALSRLGSGNGTVVRSICNDNTANNSTNSSGSSNVAGGIIGLLAGVAAVAALTHHAAAPTPAPTAPPALVPAAIVVPVAAATPAPTAPPVVAFSASHYGSIAVNMGGTIAIAALDRDSAANSMMDSINGCNAKAGGNGCTVHVQFANTADARCGAVAIRRSGRQNIIGSATAGSESDAEARALMKAGTGATILAYGCNTR